MTNLMSNSALSSVLSYFASDMLKPCSWTSSEKTRARETGTDKRLSAYRITRNNSFPDAERALLCRMFGYVGTSTDDLAMLFRALSRAAESDQLFPDQANNQHGDGWGYVLYSDDKVRYERMTDPIFGHSVEPDLDFTGTAYAIFHARKASSMKQTGDPKFQHPFRGDWEGGTIYLAHNGVIEKSRLASTLNPQIETESMVDSEVGLQYILQQRRKGLTLEEASEGLEDFTGSNSALNLLILEVPRGGRPQLFAMQFYNRDTNDGKDWAEAFQTDYLRLPSGGVGVFSSTLSRVEPQLRLARPLKRTELVLLSALS